MSHFIDKIKESVLLRIKNIPEFSNIRANTLDFSDIFQTSLCKKIIAEIKFSSPSLGKIYYGKHDILGIAREYLENGASALSILTEPHYFKGNIDYIRKARNVFPEAHILQKDFILSEIQITQALAVGANAVLLIVAFLDNQTLRNLYNYAIFLGLTPVIEVHDRQELEIALELNPKIIGINNRNLKTLEINLDTSRNLIKDIPNNIHVICESGIENKAQLQEMKSLGYEGFLIGSHFMKHENPGKALEKLTGGDYAS